MATDYSTRPPGIAQRGPPSLALLSVSPVCVPIISRSSGCSIFVFVRRSAKPSSRAVFEVTHRWCRWRSPSPSIPTTCACRPFASISGARRPSRTRCRVLRRGPPGAHPPRMRRRGLTGRWQQRASTTPTHQRRRACGVTRELSRTTGVQHDEHQRDPTNAHDSGARRASKRFVNSDNADERRPAPTGVGALITRGRRFKSCPRH